MRESVEVVLLLLLAWWVHIHVSLPAPIILCIKTVVIRSDDDVCNPFDFTSTALSFSSKDNAAGRLRSDDDEEEEEEEEEGWEWYQMTLRCVYCFIAFAQT